MATTRRKPNAGKRGKRAVVAVLDRGLQVGRHARALNLPPESMLGPRKPPRRANGKPVKGLIAPPKRPTPIRQP
jgi:hypothetical protein